MEILHRENPVLALYWPCKGLQCDIAERKIPQGPDLADRSRAKIVILIIF